MNKLFESNKKLVAIPDNPDVLFKFMIDHIFLINK